MTIKFYKTNDPYGFLNNFKKAPMYIYGLFWKNVEAPYQSQKTHFLSEKIKIWEAKTPREARDLGQQITLRHDWDHVKYLVMRECVLAKFLQHPELADPLVATGDEEIVENSPIDLFWGCGEDGSGQNNLGKILMEVRQILKNKPA